MHIHSSILHTFIYTYTVTYPHIHTGLDIFFNKSKITNLLIRFGPMSFQIVKKI